jgi:23S rRNA (guanosine2251-2'-O)-methyltransferase
VSQRPASSPRRRPPVHRRRERASDDGPITLFGVHAVAAALDNPSRVLLGLKATENAERRLAAEIAKRKITVERVRPKDLDKLLGADTVHQGLALTCDPLPEPELETLIEAASGGGPLMVLDQITDPHNVGAILRSAAVFGATGLIMTRRHSPPLNGTLAKSASGALERVPIALVQNLARAVTELTEAGLDVIGLDGEAPDAISSQDFTKPSAIVLGAEGKGLRQLTKDSCTRLVRIEALSDLTSLNVSNAAAIALHVAALQRHKA